MRACEEFAQGRIASRFAASWLTRSLKRQAQLAAQLRVLRSVLLNRDNAALYQRHHVATFAMAIDKSP
jgi:hypothetical protein